MNGQTRSIVNGFSETKDFGDVETIDVKTSGCLSGHIPNSDGTCSKCTAGTFARTETDPAVCFPCPLNTYSASAATQCVACGAGLGTLEKGSDSESDCIGI